MPTLIRWAVRCTARSKRTGLPCGNWALRGAIVCRHHGGQLPNVRLAATRRLAEAKLARAGTRPPVMSYSHALLGNREDRRLFERKVRGLVLEIRADQAEQRPAGSRAGSRQRADSP